MRGVFKDWVSSLLKGTDYNLENQSASALTHRNNGSEGWFLEDFCNWQDISEYKEFVYNSLFGVIVAKLMKSNTAQFFQRSNYRSCYSVASRCTLLQCKRKADDKLLDSPLNSRLKEVSLKCAAGTHKLPKEIRPTSWSTMESFYEDNSKFMDLPDIEQGEYDIKAWGMKPGVSVAFHFKTIHGANANMTKNVSRTISFRLVGDDARYLQRP